MNVLETVVITAATNASTQLVAMYATAMKDIN